MNRRKTYLEYLADGMNLAALLRYRSLIPAGVRAAISANKQATININLPNLGWRAGFAIGVIWCDFQVIGLIDGLQGFSIPHGCTPLGLEGGIIGGKTRGISGATGKAVLATG